MGLLIYLPAVLLPGAEPERQDLIGLGLVGEKGLVIYLSIVAATVATITAIWVLAKNGFFGFVGDTIARLPWIGRSLRVFAEARFIQTLAITIEAGVDAASAIDLAFRSAGTPQFAAEAETSSVAIKQGRDMHTVLADTGLFQEETLEVIELGEASGRLAEVLGKHFRHLKTQVRNSMAKLTYAASALIWCLVASALVFIIFRVFSLYINGLGDRGTDLITGGGL